MARIELYGTDGSQTWESSDDGKWQYIPGVGSATTRVYEPISADDLIERLVEFVRTKKLRKP